MRNFFYAIKANPGEPVLHMLAEMGSNFDIASRYELDMISKFVNDPSRFSYGNTIKKSSDIKYFYEKASAFLPQTAKMTLKILQKMHQAQKCMCVSLLKIQTLQTGH